MSKARNLADLLSDGAELADGQISVAEVVGAAPLANPTFTGTASGTFSGPLTGNVTGDVTGDVNTTLIASPTLNATVNIKTTDSNGEGIGLGIDADKKVRFYDDQGASTKMYWNASTVTQKFEDNSKLAFGSSEDLKLYHDGTNKLVGDLTQTGKLTTDATDLSALAATIADTAVDVFVYDTSKDSDGGAWRRRTQHTSWYNETLNTSTRGSRKEFPAVAVIVAESSQVTIYDGDDPDLPMWMVFNAGTHKLIGMATGGTPGSITCMTAYQGVIAIGIGAGNGRGLTTANLIAERAYYYSTGTSSRGFNGNIAERNDAKDDYNLPDIGPIVALEINDVAMTVLPNAPIDAATGLPVPTIAVATDGGTSVIKDDGTVVDIKATNASFYYTHQVSFTEDNKIILLYSYSGVADDTHVYYTEIPSSDKTFTAHSSAINANLDSNSYVTFLPQYTNQGSSLGGSKILATKQFYGGNAAGLVHYAPEDDLTKSLASDITSTYNTGWMNGDIKLATLSDTDDTDVTGSELVTGDNSTFTNGIGDWYDNTYSSTLTNTNGALTMNNTSSYQQAVVTISNALVVGKTYVWSWDQISQTSGNFRAFINTDTLTVPQNATGSFSMTFVATSTDLFLKYKRTATSGTCQVDNISVRLAEADRSVNGNGLQVFGTVTKNPVNSGADLVAYSGFSSSNYLEQPYNSDLPLDAADSFFAHCWIKTTTSNNYQILLSFGVNLTGQLRTLGLFATTGELYFGVSGSNTGGTSSVNVGTNTWRHVGVVSNGTGLVKLYLDGELYGTDTLTFQDQSGTTSTCRIGNLYGGFPMDGSVALARISATAPSPEQIAKIYEDEKHLFQTGAQATLYGSSDAVTALAYDDSTELLHVGTSAGRSDFQGLRRVNNTTNAVGAAISASNGMIVEE